MKWSDFQRQVELADLPGASVAVVDRDGTRYAHAWGTANAATGAPMRHDSVIQIASMTKALVSTAALELIAQGRIGLRDDLGRLVPQLANPQVVTGHDDNGEAITRPARGAITLHHLLTHTSGCSYGHARAPTDRPGGAPLGTDPSPLDRISLPLLFDPGDRWEYGVSTDWVGHVIETVTGGPLGDCLGAMLLEPLGMEQTVFRPALPADAASVHARTGDGAFQALPLYLGSGPHHNGGTGLTSTVPDYARFIAMLLGDGRFEGRKIIAPETRELLSTRQTDHANVGILDTVVPQMANRLDLFPGIACDWTCGFLRLPVDLPSGMRAGTLSWAGVFNCYYWIDRAANLGGIFATQLVPLGDPAALDAYSALVAAAYRETDTGE